MDAVTDATPASGPAEDIRPFSADGGRVGVVLSHGFTGTPASLRPWAEHLAAEGFSVRLPLLPGHGVHWRETNRSRWPQWYAAIEQAYEELAAQCDTVFAAGLSMGGTLVTRLAEVYGDGIAGLVLVNPAYALARFDAKLAPFIAWAVRSHRAIGGDIKKPGVVEAAADRTPLVAFTSMQRLWRVTVADLPKVTAPILLYRSVEDHVVDPLSARLLQRRATSTAIDEVLLHDSYHVATLDNDAPTIFEGSVTFFRAIAERRDPDAAGRVSAQ